MSTPVIIGFLAIGLFILVTLAVAMQNIEKNRKERKLLENNLNAKVRNFEFMQDGFPEGFLDRSLKILIAKCIQDCYQQLLDVNPKQARYQHQLERAKQQIEQLKTLSPDHIPIKLTDAQQIRDIQKMLNTLFAFVSKMAEKGRLNAKESLFYGGQLRKLMVLSTADGLDRAASDALHLGKYKLALHNVKLAASKLEKENTSGQFNDRIRGYQEQVQMIHEQAGMAQEASLKRREEHDEEWEEINKPDDSWKKKQIYD